MFCTTGAKDGAIFASFVASHAHYRATGTQIAIITKIIFTACANVAYSATFAKMIIARRTSLSAIGANGRAIFTSFKAPPANYRTIFAQFAVITEISVTAGAIVASSAVGTKNDAIFATSAILATFHMITFSATGTSVIVDTINAHAAIFAYKIIIITPLTAIGALHAVIIRSVGYRTVGKKAWRKQ